MKKVLLSNFVTIDVDEILYINPITEYENVKVGFMKYEKQVSGWRLHITFKNGKDVFNCYYEAKKDLEADYKFILDNMPVTRFDKKKYQTPSDEEK